MSTLSGVRAGRAYIEIGALDKTGMILRRVGAKLSSWGENITNFGKRMALGIAAGSLPLAYTVKAFSDFDQVMRKVEARASGTSDQMSGLRKQALDLSTASSVTAVNIGEIQNVLAQAGYNRGQILQMTESVLNLARGAGEGKDGFRDMELATNLVQETLHQFQLDASEAGRVSDVLAAAAVGSATNLEKLHESMKYVGPVAHSMGRSLEETAAMVGALSNLGLAGTMAGTGLRNMETYMSQPVRMKKFAKNLEEATGYVIPLVDELGNLRRPLDILQEIGDATRNLGTAEKVKIFSEFTGLRAQPGAMALSRPGASPFDGVMSEISNASGMASRLRKAMDAGITGTLKRIWNTVTRFSIMLGEVFSEPVMSAARGIGTFVEKAIEWAAANGDTIRTIAVLAATIIPATAAILALGMSLQFAGFALGGFGGLIGIALKSLTTLLWPLKALAALVLVKPLLALPVALAAVLAYGAGLGHRIAGVIKDTFTTLASEVRGILETATSAAGGIGQALQIGRLDLAFEVATAGLKLIWLQAVDGMYNTWDKFCTSFVKRFKGASTELGDWILHGKSPISKLVRALAQVADPGLRFENLSKTTVSSMYLDYEKLHMLRNKYAMEMATGDLSGAQESQEQITKLIASLKDQRQSLPGNMDFQVPSEAVATNSEMAYDALIDQYKDIIGPDQLKAFADSPFGKFSREPGSFGVTHPEAAADIEEKKAAMMAEIDAIETGYAKLVEEGLRKGFDINKLRESQYGMRAGNEDLTFAPASIPKENITYQYDKLSEAWMNTEESMQQRLNDYLIGLYSLKKATGELTPEMESNIRQMLSVPLIKTLGLLNSNSPVHEYIRKWLEGTKSNAPAPADSNATKEARKKEIDASKLELADANARVQRAGDAKAQADELRKANADLEQTIMDEILETQLVWQNLSHAMGNIQLAPPKPTANPYVEAAKALEYGTQEAMQKAFGSGDETKKSLDKIEDNTRRTADAIDGLQSAQLVE